jgi:hypothetical protein
MRTWCTSKQGKSGRDKGAYVVIQYSKVLKGRGYSDCGAGAYDDTRLGVFDGIWKSPVAGE